MLSEGLTAAVHQCRRTWQEPEAKRICEGVTLSLNPPLRFFAEQSDQGRAPPKTRITFIH